MIRRSRPTERPPAPAPLEVDEVRVVAIGTGVWVVALLGLLAFWGRLADADRTWWVGSALVGIGLGIIGILICRRRAGVRRRR